jgi:hypothetical protein
MNLCRRTVGVAALGGLLAGNSPAAEATGCGLALAYPVAGISIDGDLSD